MKSTQKRKILWGSLHIPFILTVLFAACFFFSSYDSVKAFFDSLSADNHLESFTPSLYQTLSPIILGIGTISLILLLLSFFFSEKSQRLLVNTRNTLKAFPKRLKDDTQLFLADAKRCFSGDKDWIFLLALMLVGLVLRISLVDRPITGDEGYTYISFVLSGLGNIVSDYHLPNNHILYSIFVYFSVHLFGNAPWALRLPSLLAGVCLIPACYLATRMYFNRQAGLLTSGIMATYPVFISYSTLVRGYAQLVLFSVLLWFLANLLIKKKNLFVWSLFTLTAAAGFYTIPIMIYPYAATMGWFFFAWLFDEYSDEYKKAIFFKYLFLSGVVVVLLFALFYLPVFVKTGVGSVFYSDTIQKNQEANFGLFLASLFTRSFRSWEEWHRNTGGITSIVSLIGLMIALIKHKVIAKKRSNHFIVSLLVIVAIVTLQQAVGWKRIWLFFAPVYFSFASAGLVYLLQKIFKRKETILLGIIIFIVGFSLGNAVFWLGGDTTEMKELRGKPGSVERAVIFLSDVITEENAIATNINATPGMKYYAYYYGIPLIHTRPANNQYTSIYAILPSPEDAIEETLHSGTRDRVNLKDAELFHSEGDLRIYKIPIIIFYDE